MAWLNHAVNNRWHTSGCKPNEDGEPKMGTEVRQRLISIPAAREDLGGIGHTTIYDLIKRRELIKVKMAGVASSRRNPFAGSASIGSPRPQVRPCRWTQKLSRAR